MTQQTKPSSIFQWILAIVAFFAVVVVMKFVLGMVFKVVALAAVVGVIGGVVYFVTRKSGSSDE